MLRLLFIYVLCNPRLCAHGRSVPYLHSDRIPVYSEDDRPCTLTKWGMMCAPLQCHGSRTNIGGRVQCGSRQSIIYTLTPALCSV